MRIHSLSFDNLRGVEHFQLSNIPDTGVVIVSGSKPENPPSLTPSTWC